MDGFLHPLPHLASDPIVEPQIGYNWTIPIGMIAFAALVIACFAIGGYITYRVPEAEQTGFTASNDHFNVKKTMQVGENLNAKSQSLGFLGAVSQDMIAQLLMSGQTISPNGLIQITGLLYPTGGGPTYEHAYAGAKNLATQFSRMTTNPGNDLADDLLGNNAEFVDPLELTSLAETITMTKQRVQLLTSANTSTAQSLTFAIQRRIPTDVAIDSLFVFTSPWLLADKKLTITTDPVGTIELSGGNPLKIGGNGSGVITVNTILVKVHVAAGQGVALQDLKTHVDAGQNDDITLGNVSDLNGGTHINNVPLTTLNEKHRITDVNVANNFIEFEIPNETGNTNDDVPFLGGDGVTLAFQINTFKDMTVFTSKPGSDLMHKSVAGGTNNTTLTLTGQKGNPNLGPTKILPGSFIYIKGVDRGANSSDIKGTVMILTDGDEFETPAFS